MSEGEIDYEAEDEGEEDKSNKGGREEIYKAEDIKTPQPRVDDAKIESIERIADISIDLHNIQFLPYKDFIELMRQLRIPINKSEIEAHVQPPTSFESKVLPLERSRNVMHMREKTIRTIKEMFQMQEDEPSAKRGGAQGPDETFLLPEVKIIWPYDDKPKTVCLNHSYLSEDRVLKHRVSKTFVAGVRHGLQQRFGYEGELQYSALFVNGQLRTLERWNYSGFLEESFHMINNKMFGPREWWSGNKGSIIYFIDDEEVSKKDYDEYMAKLGQQSAIAIGAPKELGTIIGGYMSF